MRGCVLALLCASCVVNPNSYAGRACDQSHECLEGRLCLDGRCTDTSRDAGGAGDAGSVGIDGGAGRDAGALVTGSLCLVDAQCTSGFCASGVCCSERCSGSCASCAAPKGTCSPRAMGTLGAPACSGSLLCDGLTQACPSGCYRGGCVGGIRCDTVDCVPTTAMFVDDFNGGLDTSLWATITSASSRIFVDAGALTIRTGGGNDGASLVSLGRYDLEGSSIEVDILKPGARAPSKISKLLLTIDVQHQLSIDFENGVVSGNSQLNGLYTTTLFSYADDGGFRRVRMSEDGGVVRYEAGHKGQWQLLGTQADPLGMPLRSMRVSLESFAYSVIDAGGDAVFDNLNTKP